MRGISEQEWTKNKLENNNGNNLSELLNQKAGIFVKHYGPGTLSTVSIRGSSSSQTAILWNGIPIASPTLGLLDLSLIPLAGFESVKLQKGSNNSLWGSGAIGGNVQLNNKLTSPIRYQDQGFGFNAELNGTIGSFNQRNGSAILGYGGQKLYARTKVLINSTENNFPYQKDISLPNIRLENAEQIGIHFFQDVAWEVSKKHRILLNYWYSSIDRNIPPTMVQNQSSASQYDLSNKIMLTWENENSFGNFTSKIGLIDEYNDFRDENISLESSNYFQNLFAESNFTKEWKRHKFLVGLSALRTKASTASYEINNSELKTAIFSTYNFKYKNLDLQASLRAELVNGEFIPLVPNLGFSWLMNDYLQLKGNVGRNYRLPTLNDRFWRPGGNQALLPESGWSQELGLQGSLNADNVVYEYAITGFNRNVDNWILWALDQDIGFFSARNIAKVWSRGLEPRFGATIEQWNQHFKIQFQYDLILSTNEKAIILPKIDVGSQLWYTPRHQGSIFFDWSYKNMGLNYSHYFTSSSQGINDSIDGYNIGNIRFNYEFVREEKPILNMDSKFKFQSINLFIQFNNLWNKRYFIIERRPLPGVNGQVGARLKLF